MKRLLLCSLIAIPFGASANDIPNVTIRNIEQAKDKAEAFELAVLYCVKKIANLKPGARINGNNGINVDIIGFLENIVGRMAADERFGGFPPYTVDLRNTKIVREDMPHVAYFDSIETMKNVLCCVHALEAADSK